MPRRTFIFSISHLKLILVALEKSNFNYSNWFELGILLGLKHTKLRNIESAAGNDTILCLKECLTTWLTQSGLKCNGMSLADSLDEINERQAAETIRKNFVDPVCLLLQDYKEKIFKITFSDQLTTHLQKKEVISEMTAVEVKTNGGHIKESSFVSMCTIIAEDHEKLKSLISAMLEFEESSNLAQKMLLDHDLRFREEGQIKSEPNRLDGVQEAGKKLFLINEHNQNINWEEYGFRIGSEEIVSPQEKVEGFVIALAGGRFKFPKGYSLVSAVYAIFVAKSFIHSQLKLEMQHCVKITSQSETESLKFVTAPIDNSLKYDDHYNFSIVDDGVFEVGSRYGIIFRKSFSLLGVVAKTAAHEFENRYEPRPKDDNERRWKRRENLFDDGNEKKKPIVHEYHVEWEDKDDTYSDDESYDNEDTNSVGYYSEGDDNDEENLKYSTLENERPMVHHKFIIKNRYAWLKGIEERPHFRYLPVSFSSCIYCCNIQIRSKPFGSQSCRYCRNVHIGSQPLGSQPPDMCKFIDSDEIVTTDLFYTGIVYYEVKTENTYLMTFSVAKDLEALKRYIDKEHPNAEKDIWLPLRFLCTPGYIELDMNASQEEAYTGWSILPHKKPCQLWQDVIDKFGSTNHPDPASCLISVHVRKAPDTVPFLHYAIPLHGIADSEVIFIIRSITPSGQFKEAQSGSNVTKITDEIDSQIACEVLRKNNTNIKDAQIDFDYLIDEMLAKEIINEREKKKITDKKCGDTENQRIDDLLEILISTIAIDGNVFTIFIEILKNYRTKRTDHLADTLQKSYKDKIVQ